MIIMGMRCKFWVLGIITGVVTFTILKNGWTIDVLSTSSLNVRQYLKNLRADSSEVIDQLAFSKQSLFRLQRHMGKYYGDATSGRNESGKSSYVPKHNKTVILMWTKYYNLEDEWVVNRTLTGRKWDPSCCSGEDIVITANRSALPTATVLVFYNFFGNLLVKDLPPTRYPDQIWVLFCKESPAHSLSLVDFPNMFNWTMSYRLDSEIWAPYGYPVPLENPIPSHDPIIMPGNVTLDKWIANKTDMLFGVMSHCNISSKREQVVQALRNANLSVEVYGSCGNHSICSRHNKHCDHVSLWRNLGAKYFFYFAAENSICVDYITEKLWRSYENGMVPLVYGGGNYKLVAPPNSVIDMRDFSSPKEVVDYLKKVAGDPEEYAKYFEWRRRYDIRFTDGWGGWCKLCKLATNYRQNPTGMPTYLYNTYQNLSKWWLNDGDRSKKRACTGPLFHL